MRKYLVQFADEEFVVQVRLLTEDEQPNSEQTGTDSGITAVPPKEKVIDKQCESLEAPLGGTILKINVKVGDRVKTGDLLMTLEALKLENEITAPFDGEIMEVMVSTGSTIDLGDPLLTIQKAEE